MAVNYNIIKFIHDKVFYQILYLYLILFMWTGGENSQGQTNQGLTSINFSGLPPNINIQNITGLSGINIANLQGLQNLQMSNIAVPVPISLVSSNAGMLQNQGGIFVSSIPGLVTVSSSTPTTLSQMKQVQVTVNMFVLRLLQLISWSLKYV